jgi:dTDP-4-amino-4,6-dideoxygalactose transaminase
MIHYPIAPHLQKAYESLEIKEGNLKISEQIHANIFSLPMDPTLEIEDIRYIAKSLMDILEML